MTKKVGAKSIFMHQQCTKSIIRLERILESLFSGKNSKLSSFSLQYTPLFLNQGQERVFTFGNARN
jgi:GTPase